MRQSPRYIAQRVRWGTARPTLDLLNLPLPLTQVPLLDAREVAAEAGRRRIRLEVEQLELLHRHRLLVPMFEVSLMPTSRPPIDVSASETPRIGTSTYIQQLYAAAADGRASDPRRERFRAWPSRRRPGLWPQRDRGYLYSQHQLLALKSLRPVLRELRWEHSQRGSTWSLAREDRPTAADIAIADSWRNLAIALSALDGRYWPRVTGSISYDAEAWRRHNQSFDLAGTLSWTGLTADQVADQAAQLRDFAAFADVVGEFYDLVRRAGPRAWATLRGDALVAMGFRVAAEALDQFADDLGRGQDAAEGVRWSPLHAQRLSDRPRSTDAALTALGLSPHPSLVVGVEGKTELLLVPRVLELLGVDADLGLIRVESFGGVGKDLALLARYAAAPVIGVDRGTWVELDRPITRFLVLVDAESKYSTPEKRRRQRKLLLDEVAAALPEDLRNDLYVRNARIVEIRTWGRLPFEFAHFTDRQLASVLTMAAATPHPIGDAALIADLAVERARAAPNVDRVYSMHKWPGARLSKPVVAEASWPLLAQRIKRAIARSQQGPPIMRAMLRAWELANLSPRSGMALRRHKAR